MSRLASKVAIVTGASSGIGRATALAMHRQGALVLCSDIRDKSRNDRSDEKNIDTHDEITKEGGQALYVKADVSKSDHVEGIVKAAVEKFGRLDIMVNNAGVSMEASNPMPIWDFNDDVFQKTMDINAKGVYYGMKFASRQMMKQEQHKTGSRGWIVNLSSILGIGGTPNSTAYCASKFAVMGMTKVAAWDLAPHRIHVNAINPGYTDTAMPADQLHEPLQKARLLALHPFRGFGKPEDMANAAVFLASEENTWITGTGLAVDGGYLAQ